MNFYKQSQNRPSQRIEYIDTRQKDAAEVFSEAIYAKLKGKLAYFDEMIIMCIGTDRSTGDSLGPITGYKLSESGEMKTQIYGTLEKPVHAKNLAETLEYVRARHKNPLVVAIDASLGRFEHIGYVTVGYGSIHPGAGINKRLPPVGDIFVTGIVNFCGELEYAVLQNTRLNVVMKMADVIVKGMVGALARLS